MNGFVSLSSSSRLNNDLPVRILFPTQCWDSGPMFSWYKLDTTLKRIQTLQVRLDASGPVPHRFIVAYVSNECGATNSIYRFDRRPESNAVDVVNAALRDTDSGIAKDEYIPGVDASSFESTQCEVELGFSEHVDLLEIIKACYGMSQDKEAKNYTLRRYNCFFFSWTILMFVARRHLPYKVPDADDVLHRFLSHAPRLIDSIVAEAVKLFLSFVIDTITTFRSRDHSELLAGLNGIERILWGLPTGLIQFFWQKTFRFHLHLGMRQQLKTHIGAQLTERAKFLCPEVLNNHLKGESLDNYLWLKDSSVEVREALGRELMKVLWDGILDAIAGDLGKEPLEPANSTPLRLKFSIFGPKMAQLTAVWNAALPAGLRAARNAARGKSSDGQVNHEEMFELAWSAARDTTLKTVRQVVDRTRWQIKNKEKHDLLWEAVWGMWGDCWDLAHRSARPKAIGAIERVVEDVIATGVGSVIESMQQSSTVTVKARVFASEEKRFGSRLSDLEMTNAGLEQHMQNIMKHGTLGTDTLADITKTMGEIWRKAKALADPDVQASTSS